MTSNPDQYEFLTAEQRQAKFKAEMAEWHAYQKRAAKAAREFNANFHRNWDHQGPVYHLPKDTYKKDFYEGGHRMIINGMPTRVAAHVKAWRGSIASRWFN